MRARRLVPIIAAFAIAAGGTATAAADPGTASSAATGTRAYFVITTPGDASAATQAITSHGGTVYASYDQIGVLVAHSSDSGFADAVRGAAGVEQVGATRTSARQRSIRSQKSSKPLASLYSCHFAANCRSAGDQAPGGNICPR